MGAGRAPGHRLAPSPPALHTATRCLVRPHQSSQPQLRVPSESTLPFPTLARLLDQFGSCTPSTKRKTSLSPPTPIRARNWKLRLSPPPPAIAHWHVHATSILSDGGVFLGTDLLVQETPPDLPSPLLGRNWLGWGFSTSAHTGTDPNIFVSTTKCHQQGCRANTVAGCWQWLAAGSWGVVDSVGAVLPRAGEAAPTGRVTPGPLTRRPQGCWWWRWGTRAACSPAPARSPGASATAPPSAWAAPPPRLTLRHAASSVQ